MFTAIVNQFPSTVLTTITLGWNQDRLKQSQRDWISSPSCRLCGLVDLVGLFRRVFRGHVDLE